MAIDETARTDGADDNIDKLLEGVNLDGSGDSQDGGQDPKPVNDAAEEQLEIDGLFPPRPARSIAGFKYIPVDQVWAPYPLRKPTSEQRESIKRWGVRKPIEVIEETSPDGARAYRLEDGQRRLVIAQELGTKTIPAVFHAGGDPYAGALTESTTTEENPAADLFFVENLIEQGFSQRQIQTATRMRASEVKKLLKYARLIPRLRDPFDRGELIPSLARKCADLPTTTQERLAALYESREPMHLTSADIKAEREAIRQTSAAQTGLGLDDDSDDDTDGTVSRGELIEAFGILWTVYQDGSPIELGQEQKVLLERIALDLGLVEE